MDKIALLALKKSGAVDVGLAVAAKEAAEAAQEAAETAQGKAEDAAEELEQTVEDVAELKTDVSSLLSQIKATEIVVQSESKPIVQIADGSANNAKSYDVQITPQQDLHGYDNPWPAGGGKNLFHFSAGREAYSWNDGFELGAISAGDDGVKFNGTSTSSHSFSVSGAEIVLSAGKYRISTESSNVGLALLENGVAVPDANNYGTGGVYFTIDHEAHVTLQITVLSGASFSNKFVGIQIESGENATSWVPYSNICPISGWTGAEVSRNAGNMAAKDSVSNNYVIGSTGSLTYELGAVSTDYMPVEAGDTVSYSFVSKEGPRARRVYAYNADKTANSELYASAWVTVNAKVERTFTIPSGVAFVRACYYSGDTDKMLTNHETTYSIDFPQSAGTVYGGNLHVNEDGSGTLVVDKAEFDMGTLNWGSNGVINRCQRYSAAVRVMENGFDNDAISSIFESNKAPVGGSSAGKDNTICRYSGSIYVNCNAYVDNLLGFKDFVNGQIVIVPLATPQTYTLTAPQIALLLGENNLWADTGDMAVEYIADTKLYIQTLTGHPDEDMIADSNIPSGQFFMVGNRLFISTSAIASGETIVPGTNCTETNLAAALNTINAD